MKTSTKAIIFIVATIIVAVLTVAGIPPACSMPIVLILVFVFIYNNKSNKDKESNNNKQ